MNRSKRGPDCRCGLIAVLLTVVSFQTSDALVSSSTLSRMTAFRTVTNRCLVLQSTADDMAFSLPREEDNSPKATKLKKTKIPLRIRKLTRVTENSAQLRLEAEASWEDGGGSRKSKTGKQAKKKRAKKSTHRIPSPSELSKSFQNQMADHELLTREEELDLGRQVQEAMRLQEVLTEMVDEKLHEKLRETQGVQLHWQETQANPIEESDPLVRPYQSYEDEMDALLINGQGRDEDFENPDPHELSLVTDNNGFSVLDKYDDPTSLTLDDLEPDEQEHFQRQNFAQLSQMEDSVLSDAEIMAAFDGIGRKELRRKLLNGAVAKEKLIRCNIRLVMSIARDWAFKTVKVGELMTLNHLYVGNMYRPSLDEAIHEGILGLARAAEKYDPSRGRKFSTYSHHWITSYVSRCYQNQKLGVNKAPRRYHALKNKYQRFLRECYEKGNEIPPRKDIAAILGVTESRLNTVLSAMRPVVSLNEPVKPTTGGNMLGNYGDESVELGDLILSQEDTPNEYVEMCFLRQTLENALATELTPNERDVVRLRLGLDDGKSRTAKQVAALCGGAMTIREVRRVERQAYRKLRSEQLMAFLDIDHLTMEKVRRRQY